MEFIEHKIATGRVKAPHHPPHPPSAYLVPTFFPPTTHQPPGSRDASTGQKFGVLFQRRDAAANQFRRNILPISFQRCAQITTTLGLDPEQFGRLAPRCPCFDRFDYSYTQVP
jgi:hypothetical protein